jgi:hypothetical protein
MDCLSRKKLLKTKSSGRENGHIKPGQTDQNVPALVGDGLCGSASEGDLSPFSVHNPIFIAVGVGARAPSEASFVGDDSSSGCEVCSDFA